jgi:phosphomannomutase
MAGIFKAYDVRGIYPDQLDEKLARKIGLAAQHVIDQSGPWGKSVVVGYDMRPHSKPLVAALTEGLLAAGFDVIDVGLVTTPMNYFAVGTLKAAGGVQVTASHNPAQYNGMKFSLHEARPVSGDDGIAMLEKKIAEGDLDEAAKPGTRREYDIKPAYAEHLLSFVRSSGGRTLKVVVDAANGMGALYRPLLEQMNIDLIPLYFELDGTFPNHEANPLKYENLKDLCAKVLETGADLGVSFDGDADRAAFVDEQGSPIGSDLSTALIGGELLRAKGAGTVVYDVRSSRALPEYLTDLGGTPRRERVGHSFIKATMRETNAIFGGELAGHYYFPENFYADNSLLAVIYILNLLWQDDRSITEHLAPLMRYSKSEEINFEVEDKEAMMNRLAEHYSSGTIDRLDGISIDFDDWWFNVRPSNTEPLLRLVLEAATPAMLEEKTAELVAIMGQPV